MSIRTALENRLARIENNEKGFTLIELLVVVIIIGILAAIAVPVFLGQQAQAQNSAAISNLATAKVAYVSYLVDEPGGATAVNDELRDLGWPAADADGEVVTISVGGREFCFTAVSDSGDTFIVDSGAEGPRQGTCTVPTP
jgi:prepilin-type N-terminal cleavage/methylation domain-containing protein